MLRSKEITGSPVISIAGGVQIGTVKGLLINPQQKTVEFLLLNEPKAAEGVHGLPFSYAEGLGEYAVTVENENALIQISRIGALRQLMEKSTAVIGTKIITRKGKLLGDAAEFSIDPESGNIKEIYYQDKDREKVIPAQSVITLGQEVLIVEDTDALQTLDHTAFSTESSRIFNGKGEKASFENAVEPAKEQVSLEDTIITERALLSAHPAAASADLDPASIFMQRQRQFLIGKTLLKDLQSRDGETIAWENEVVTEELFEKVYRLGTQKIMELAMVVRD